MKIMVTGASGLIGGKLTKSLQKENHEVVRVSRKRDDNNLFWDPSNKEIDPAALENIDCVIHLAGENIAGRWTSVKKQKIRDSRKLGTSFLTQALAKTASPPKVLICASAIGYYGDRGEEEIDEKSKFGKGFLADVVREWEAATTPASVKGIRVVNMRFGVVLSAEGGALAKMLPPFRMGLGGIVGDGKQFWSWVALDDVVGALLHVLNNGDIEGPVNVVSPNPATNATFTKALGKTLSKPTLLPMPKLAVKIALGEMGEALLLASARVRPRKLLNSGYEFKYPELMPALKNILDTHTA